MNKMRVKREVSRPTVATADWKDLTLSDRIATITKLKCAGNSNRSIGRTLGVDDGTVRRLLRIAALPERSKQAIAKGVSANRVLAEAGRNAAEPLVPQGAQVSRYAETIVRWLQEHGILGPYAERVLLDIDGGLPPSGKRTEGRQPNFSNIAAAIQNFRPATLEDPEHHLNPFIDWGRAWISHVVPRDLLSLVMAEACRFVVANPGGSSGSIVWSEQFA